MARFHLTSEGVKPCRAFLKSCPYGGQPHFTNEAEAQAAYEAKNEALAQRVLSKRNTPPLTVSNPFNSEGLTTNMVDFRKDLRSVRTMIESYDKYRARGLSEEKYLPDAPLNLLPYLNNSRTKDMLRQLDYEGVQRVYTEALKTYYMEKVFTEADIDCLFDDEEIKGYATPR